MQDKWSKKCGCLISSAEAFSSESRSPDTAWRARLKATAGVHQVRALEGKSRLHRGKPWKTHIIFDCHPFSLIHNTSSIYDNLSPRTSSRPSLLQDLCRKRQSSPQDFCGCDILYTVKALTMICPSDVWLSVCLLWPSPRYVQDCRCPGHQSALRSRFSTQRISKVEHKGLVDWISRISRTKNTKTRNERIVVHSSHISCRRKLSRAKPLFTHGPITTGIFNTSKTPRLCK